MIHTDKKILIVGIKGVAMAHIAVILKKMGFSVEGADVDERFITDYLLAEHGITLHNRFDIEVMPDEVSHVIYSAAHGGTDNPMVQRATASGVRVVHQSEFLGELLKEFKTVIGVCGTHGKTTTSSLLAHALINLGAAPSYLVGAPSFGNRAGSDFSGTDYFVIEADEYGINPPKNRTPKFHFLNPHRVIATNIDFDHPDVYRTLHDVKKAFARFLAGKKVVACFDDDTLMDVLTSSGHKTFVTYGFHAGADAQITQYASAPDGSRFDIVYAGSEIRGIQSGLNGRKNALNTAGVVTMLSDLGFSAQDIVNALKGFGGAKRRMEVLYNADGYTIIDDYAHHPGEIEATVAAVRERFPGAPLRAVFQPHTFSRTEALLPAFCGALGKADAAYIAPIFASARERSSVSKITSRDLEKGAAALGYPHVKAFDSTNALTEQLSADFKPGETLLIMGAGDIYKIAPTVISALK